MLGLGIGWLREEFAAIGVPFEHRGKRANEYLEALKAVWTGEEVNYRGEFCQLAGFCDASHTGSARRSSSRHWWSECPSNPANRTLW